MNTPIEKSSYQLQADKFLEQTKTTIEVRFLFNGPYFDDDKEHRDVYEITLNRPTRSPNPFIFRFGQSLAASTDGKEKHLETCKAFHQRGEKCFKPKHRIKPTKPTSYDVLTCLTKYDPGTFENFCGDYGYDTDSRKAEKVYFAVQQEFDGVRRLFGDVLDQLAEIQ